LFIVVNFDVLVLFYFNFQSTKISATVCKLNNATTVKAWGTDWDPRMFFARFVRRNSTYSLGKTNFTTATR